MMTKGMKGALKDSRGFTLMELIIVMTILAILVGLAVLYYGNLTADGYRTALLTDLKQVDTAVALYQSNYNALPTTGNTVDISTVATADLPAVLSLNGYVNITEIDGTNSNLLSYIKKSTFLLKGNPDGDIRGAGRLYYVNSITDYVATAEQAVAATASTLQLDAANTFADDELNGAVIYITSGAGAGQAREITGYVSVTDTATVSPDWEVTIPDDTSMYIIKPPVKVGEIVLIQTATTESNRIYDADGDLIYKY